MSLSADASYLAHAYRLALRSPDLSTQNGAVIVGHPFKGFEILGEGWNTMPFGVQINETRLSRPTKYTYTEHAERNAIYDAARRGNKLENATMYCPWFACADCGRAIIQTGIRRVVGHRKMFDGTPRARWGDSINAAFEMFNEAGVETVLIDPENTKFATAKGDGTFDNGWDLPEIRFNEVLWKP